MEKPVDAPQSVEAIGTTVEEAVGRGMDALNATRDQVSVDVIESGGGRMMARVRVTLLPQTTGESPAETAPLTGDEMQAARDVLRQMLRHMRVQAEVDVRQAEAEDEHDESAPGGPPLILNLAGDDLGILIGRRGETLRDLQYLARAIVSKQAGRNVNLVVDVEGYKARREQALRQMAARMAERVVATRKPIALEPMPANERRIVHLALRNHPSVTTQSVGQGESRKVTLVPKSRTR
jgi:spoIIIJ-associated protein